MKRLALLALALFALNCDAVLDEEMDGDDSNSSSSTKKPADEDEDEKQPVEEEEEPDEEEPTAEVEPEEEAPVEEEEEEEPPPPTRQSIVGKGCKADSECVKLADDEGDAYRCGVTSEEKSAGLGTTCHEACAYPNGMTCTVSDEDCWMDKSPSADGLPRPPGRGLCAPGSEPI